MVRLHAHPLFKIHYMANLPFSFDDLHSKVLPIMSDVNILQKEAFKGEVAVSFKNDMGLSSSILTETDLQSDAYYREKLSAHFPEFGFVTEEEATGLDNHEYFWVIDPIDGTANFAAKIPLFGSSVALWGPSGPVYGVLAFPMLDIQLYGWKGGGAFYNGVKINLDSIQSEKSNYIFGETKSFTDALVHLDKVKDVISFPFNFRSAIYSYAQVILGKFAGLIYYNLAPWDIAAGLIISEEVGLHNEYLSGFPDPKDPDFRKYKHSVITARKSTAEAISSALRA